MSFYAVKVSLFEKYKRPGLGNHSFPVPQEEVVDGEKVTKTVVVDIPQRAVVSGYYSGEWSACCSLGASLADVGTELMELYESLGVRMVTTNGSGAYCDAETRRSYFR